MNVIIDFCSPNTVGPRASRAAQKRYFDIVLQINHLMANLIIVYHKTTSEFDNIPAAQIQTCTHISISSTTHTYFYFKHNTSNILLLICYHKMKTEYLWIWKSIIPFDEENEGRKLSSWKIKHKIFQD